MNEALLYRTLSCSTGNSSVDRWTQVVDQIKLFVEA